MSKLIRLGKINNKIFIDYFNIEKKVMLGIRAGRNYVLFKINPRVWFNLIQNCKKQKKQEGKTKTKVLIDISPCDIIYEDNIALQKKYVKTESEKKVLQILEKIHGKGKLPSKDLVSNEVSITIDDFNIMLDKKKYFKVRDCIISSEKKLKKIV